MDIARMRGGAVPEEGTAIGGVAEFVDAFMALESFDA
jgi:hypothetical protein